MGNDREQRESLYAEYRKELLAAQRSNSESLDKAVLSLSTAFLGFSLAFIRYIIPVEASTCLFLLKFSWALFCVAITSTLVSFLTSQIGIIKQLKYAEKSYLENNKAFNNKTTRLAGITIFINVFSSIIFILAVLFTIIYVWINLKIGV